MNALGSEGIASAPQLKQALPSRPGVGDCVMAMSVRASGSSGFYELLAPLVSRLVMSAAELPSPSILCDGFGRLCRAACTARTTDWAFSGGAIRFQPNSTVSTHSVLSRTVTQGT